MITVADIYLKVFELIAVAFKRGAKVLKQAYLEAMTSIREMEQLQIEW